MAINRVDFPSGTSAPVSGDWSKLIDIIKAQGQGMVGAASVVGSNIIKGSVLWIQGVTYIADADTAITGTSSFYVKITPSGATAAASYVATLTGVSFNSTYSGYYDASGNLYLFNENIALADGEILSKNKEIEKKTDVITGLYEKIIEIGSWDMDTISLNTVAHGLSDYTKIRSIKVTIIEDGAGGRIFDGGVDNGLTQIYADSTDISMRVLSGSFFDAATFNDPAINRGHIIIRYSI